MNNRYLYRAKRTDNGEWVEGFLVKKHGLFFIYSVINSDTCGQSNYEVDESTICQCTGLKDKNGKKIFEGDVVKDSAGVCGEVKFGLYAAGFSIPDTNQGFYIEFPEESLYRKERGYWENKVVVIGNIYDSPKLLEDKENKHGKDI